ncbi:hypothetical protein AKJ43_01615 [candidate division MSBL1 archaeon SCGC-AAA261D19]|uniref:Uncharacterized protein n=1 Tax=candidate division MSBL1 archaeon SCGC-AAA261D19 TaxID=1698273 RepID=A0A133V7Q8_9EURY|nr:hypothetical protein AKJ43_01615 [candidate division MSBL1 archaeon SCGC-AAA261D19]
MLMPRVKGKGIKLVCSNCGSWQKLTNENDYKIGGRKKERKTGKVAVVERSEEEEEKRKKKLREELGYDIDTDAYAELYESY